MEDRLGIPGRGGLAVTALGSILAVTVGWWGFALWPLPATVPAWIERARYVCFGSSSTGLPDAGGWILLVGQPLGMVLILVSVWREELGLGIRSLAESLPGRVLIGCTGLLLAAGITLASARLASGGQRFDAGSSGQPTALVPVNHPAPAVRLVDQRGDSVSLERFHGREVFLGFAFAHCQTVCPTIVREILEVQAAARPKPAVVIITLDPWRDPPARLPAIAAAWGMGEDAYLLSGDVAEVERVLDRWRVRRSRNKVTGEVEHQTHVHLLDPAGTVAYTVPGYRSALGHALAQLRVVPLSSP
jgi:protein SCO1/2